MNENVALVLAQMMAPEVMYAAKIANDINSS